MAGRHWNAAAVRLRAAIDREREECAKVLDDLALSYRVLAPRESSAADIMHLAHVGVGLAKGAAAIRARKDAT